MRTPPPGAPGPAGSADSPQWAKESPDSSLASSPSHAEPGWPLHSPSGEEPSVPTLPYVTRYSELRHMKPVTS